MPSWPNAIGRIARTISAIAEMRVGFLCIRLDGRPRRNSFDEILLHMVDADQRAQECIPAHHFGV